MMKQAIINILNALADRIRPCGHQWDQIAEVVVRGDGYGGMSDSVTGYIWIHRCLKCGELRKIKS